MGRGPGDSPEEPARLNGPSVSARTLRPFDESSSSCSRSAAAARSRRALVVRAATERRPVGVDDGGVQVQGGEPVRPGVLGNLGHPAHASRSNPGSGCRLSAHTENATPPRPQLTDRLGDERDLPPVLRPGGPIAWNARNTSWLTADAPQPSSGQRDRLRRGSFCSSRNSSFRSPQRSPPWPGKSAAPTAPLRRSVEGGAGRSRTRLEQLPHQRVRSTPRSKASASSCTNIRSVSRTLSRSIVGLPSANRRPNSNCEFLTSRVTWRFSLLVLALPTRP